MRMETLLADIHGLSFFSSSYQLRFASLPRALINQLID